MPPRLASIKASPVAHKWMKASILVITLITAALPSGPTWKILLPIASSAGRCFANTSAPPPTITVMSPVAARCTPPVTGHSSTSAPLACATAARRLRSASLLVLISIQVAPFLRPLRTPRSPASTCIDTAGEGRHVITASTCSATACGFSAHVAPRRTRSAPTSGLTSVIARSNPFLTRLPASFAPRLPSPMKP